MGAGERTRLHLGLNSPSPDSPPVSGLNFTLLERQARFARPSMTTINFNNINELKSIYFFKKYVKKLYLVSLI